MTLMRTMLVCLLLLTLSVNAIAAEELPRVLFLGDRIHGQMVEAAARELKGRVRVEFPPVDAPDSGTALSQFDELLGKTKWDLIYFNFGFGDLLYKDPRSKEIRALSKAAGGVRVTSAEQYEKNLDELVKRLKATGAKLVWATTTPMVDVKNMSALFDAGSEIQYNQMASGVMKKHDVPVNDMHAFVMQHVKPDGHPFFQTYFNFLQKSAPMQKPVVQAILNATEKQR